MADTLNRLTLSAPDVALILRALKHPSQHGPCEDWACATCGLILRIEAASS